MRGNEGSPKTQTVSTAKILRLAGLIPHRVYQQRPSTAKGPWGAKPTVKKVGRKRE